uniref:Uncharacterized protein n=1 Tax=Ixodes ricinus TaxID=34613 RepID=A0A6B0V3M3_IXORI
MISFGTVLSAVPSIVPSVAPVASAPTFAGMGGGGDLTLPRGGGGGAGSGRNRIPVPGVGFGGKRRSFACGDAAMFVYRSLSSFLVSGDSTTITNVSVMVAATSDGYAVPSLCAALSRTSASDSEWLLLTLLRWSSLGTLTVSTVRDRCLLFMRGGACGTFSSAGNAVGMATSRSRSASGGRKQWTTSRAIVSSDASRQATVLSCDGSSGSGGIFRMASRFSTSFLARKSTRSSV